MEDFQPASLHFYMANFSGMRHLVNPGLSRAYEHWLSNESLEPLAEYVEKARSHWLSLARQILALREETPSNEAFASRLGNLVERHYL